MTPAAGLVELIDRVAALQGKTVLINADELTQWPTETVEELKTHSLIRKTRPATNVVCTESEEECQRPVHTITDTPSEPTLFVICEKRDDINRIPVPINRVEQWQTSGTLLADFLSGLLGLRRPATDSTTDSRWEIGMLKGKKHSSHLVLLAGDSLTLTLAGHTLPLTDVLKFENNQIMIDIRTLTRLVDQPVAGAGDIESAEQRRERIKKRVDELKAQGVKAFLKTVAEEEDLSITRIKQLINDDNPAPKSKTSYW